MTSQDVHRPRDLCEDVLSKVTNSQLARTGSVPGSVTQHVDSVHLPPEVLQIQLEPPPRQLAGPHPVEERYGPLLRHEAIQPKTNDGQAPGCPSIGGTREGAGKVALLASPLSWSTNRTEFDMTLTTVQRPPRNGVDVPTLFATLDAVKGAPQIAQFQFRATNEWISGTHNR